MPPISFSSLTAADWILNVAVATVAVVVFVVLSGPRIAGSESWRATVTPLASIIGSGFLVVAPLLGATVGTLAVVAMVGIVALAHAVGGALRYNIAHLEDVVEGDHPSDRIDEVLVWLAQASKLVLAAAYVVAVAFYLELLGAFVVRLTGVRDPVVHKAVATALVLFIGGFGVWRGLSILERMETRAVDTKLAVIGALVAGLAAYNVGLVLGGDWTLPDRPPTLDLVTVRQLLGAFLIVQGFETSRYLRGEYPPERRIATMRRAQWLAAAIYVTFVALATVLLGRFDGISETAIIDLSAGVAFVLPYLLVLGAVTSQFSAAVADTIASGGLAEEGSRGRIGRRWMYGAVVVLVLGLLWSTDILSVIAYASRGFAAFYAIQAAMAAVAAGRSGSRGRAAWFALLSLAMIATAAFGIPAEARS